MDDLGPFSQQTYAYALLQNVVDVVQLHTRWQVLWNKISVIKYFDIRVPETIRGFGTGSARANLFCQICLVLKLNQMRFAQNHDFVKFTQAYNSNLMAQTAWAPTSGLRNIYHELVRTYKSTISPPAGCYIKLVVPPVET
ncbi:hypothetical protein TWF173_001167 [Orbilia oligospora]|nr:hypothetical protein TWF173_001167 [Orbilia oligospora]